MERFLAFIIITAVLLLPLFVEAHGKATHILGTVAEATNDQITVKTPKGEIVTIYFGADTIFQQNGITLNEARPKVGNRLIAEVAIIKGKLVAEEVKFATAKTK